MEDWGSSNHADKLVLGDWKLGKRVRTASTFRRAISNAVFKSHVSVDLRAQRHGRTCTRLGISLWWDDTVPLRVSPYVSQVVNAWGKEMHISPADILYRVGNLLSFILLQRR
jgi:hypothetical protein